MPLSAQTSSADHSGRCEQGQGTLGNGGKSKANARGDSEDIVEDGKTAEVAAGLPSGDQQRISVENAHRGDGAVGGKIPEVGIREDKREAGEGGENGVPAEEECHRRGRLGQEGPALCWSWQYREQ